MGKEWERPVHWRKVWWGTLNFEKRPCTIMVKCEGHREHLKMGMWKFELPLEVVDIAGNGQHRSDSGRPSVWHVVGKGTQTIIQSEEAINLLDWTICGTQGLSSCLPVNNKWCLKSEIQGSRKPNNIKQTHFTNPPVDYPLSPSGHHFVGLKWSRWGIPIYKMKSYAPSYNPGCLQNVSLQGTQQKGEFHQNCSTKWRPLPSGMNKDTIHTCHQKLGCIFCNRWGLSFEAHQPFGSVMLTLLERLSFCRVVSWDCLLMGSSFCREVSLTLAGKVIILYRKILWTCINDVSLTLQMMLPGTCIKCTVFEAAGRPHFVHEIYRGFFTKPPPVLLERIRRALGDSAGFPRRFGTGNYAHRWGRQ